MGRGRVIATGYVPQKPSFSFTSGVVPFCVIETQSKKGILSTKVSINRTMY